VIWFAGIIRGGVAYALIQQLSNYRKDT